MKPSASRVNATHFRRNSRPSLVACSESFDVSRRDFLKKSALLAGVTFPFVRVRAATPSAKILETKVISQHPHLYHGWSTVARRRNGQLLLVCSGGRQGHVCPFGRVELMTSDDDGEMWTFPRVLLDSAIDDRDAGILETNQGTLLVTTFSSLAYEDILKQAVSSGSWPEEKRQAWNAVHTRLTAEERQAELGQWMLRSEDGGVTWSKRYFSVVNSPHGPIQLGDGRLLYAGKELWTGERRVGVCQSTDDGKTWDWLAEIPVRPGDRAAEYHELHAVETRDRRIIVQIRNHNSQNQRETLQSESPDGGHTWTKPRSIGVWGLPSHLLPLRDGRILMSYGHRRPPFGNQARFSTNSGRNWSEPMIVSGDGARGDLGYPSTVELEGGTLLTVWYELLSGNRHAVLRQARWKLES